MRDELRAAALGAASGLRTFMGMAWWTTCRQAGVPAAVATPTAARVWAACAAGELIADKLPFVPDRVRPGPLLARAAMGALLGRACAAARGNRVGVLATIGSLAAVAAAFTGYTVRQRAAQAGLPDLPVALLEDAAAVALAATAAAAREKNKQVRRRPVGD